MSAVRIAVVGAGNWGRNHVRTLASMADVELAAVCDIDDERRAELSCQYPGLRVTASLDEAFDGADGVVVATPVTSHVPVAREAVQRGLPTLIEKPMALSLNEAKELASLVDETAVPVLSGHLLVFHPAIEYLQEIIQSGDLGTIYYLYSQRVNLGQIRPDENALWSFGPHDVSVALRLLGEAPVRVAAHGKSYLQPGIEDVVFLLLEMPSGAMVHVQMSWLDPHKKRQLTVVGSRKMVVFDDMQAREKIKIYDKGVDRPPTYASYGESLAVREGEILIPRIPNVEPLRAELEHFAAVIRGEVEPRSGVQDGLEVVRILEAASESLQNGGRVIEMASASAGTT